MATGTTRYRQEDRMALDTQNWKGYFATMPNPISVREHHTANSSLLTSFLRHIVTRRSLTPKLKRGLQGTDPRLPKSVRCGPSPPGDPHRGPGILGPFVPQTPDRLLQP